MTHIEYFIVLSQAGQDGGNKYQEKLFISWLEKK